MSKGKVCEPLLYWTEGGNQSHGEIGVSMTRATTHPTRGKVEKRRRPRCPKECENASKKTAWGFRTREQDRGITAGRRVVNKSDDGEPQACSRAVATNGWRDHAVPKTDADGRDLPEQRTALVDTPHRGGGRGTRTTPEGDGPTGTGSGTLSRPAN